ncbi:hypothetical protein PEC18_19305 [Paucibacter sp. O1-1]|nr:hypothetical protein [Paucibacter sp. O1-1]MDA3827935.1 hypothetical protein [Paucibacter sp. O1-1]
MVLGLVASVTVAPWLARHVVSVAAFAALLPVALGAVGLAWPSAPAGWRRRATGYEPWLCVPVIAGVALAVWLIGSGITHALGVGEPATPQNLLLVGIVLGLAVMPMLTLAEDALFVPAHLTDGALALGAFRWQALVRLVVPAAALGLFAAVLLCLSRALGETMIVPMAKGNTPDATGNPFVGLRAISANLALEAPEAVPGSAHYRLLLTSALLLFVLCFILNSVADAACVRLRRRLAGLWSGTERPVQRLRLRWRDAAGEWWLAGATAMASALLALLLVHSLPPGFRRFSGAADHRAGLSGGRRA